MGCTRKMHGVPPTKAAIAAMGDLLGAEEIAVCNPPAGRSPAQGKGPVDISRGRFTF